MPALRGRLLPVVAVAAVLLICASAGAAIRSGTATPGGAVERIELTYDDVAGTLSTTITWAPGARVGDTVWVGRNCSTSENSLPSDAFMLTIGPSGGSGLVAATGDSIAVTVQTGDDGRTLTARVADRRIAKHSWNCAAVANGGGAIAVVQLAAAPAAPGD